MGGHLKLGRKVDRQRGREGRMEGEGEKEEDGLGAA